MLGRCIKNKPQLTRDFFASKAAEPSGNPAYPNGMEQKHQLTRISLNQKFPARNDLDEDDNY